MLKKFRTEVKKRWNFISNNTSNKKFILFMLLSVSFAMSMASYAFILIPNSIIKSFSFLVFSILYFHAIFFYVIYDFLGGNDKVKDNKVYKRRLINKN